MLTKVRYSARDIFLWTRYETAVLVVYAAIITGLYAVADFRFLHLPWAPVAVVGTAVAFIVGFQNNAAYGRIWEARKIWGGIVNASRAFGMRVSDGVTNEHTETPLADEELAKERGLLIERHIAWLSALRHAMRQPRDWEVIDREQTNREWSESVCIPERVHALKEDLARSLPAEELASVMARTNKPAAILYHQSRHLRELKERGLIWEFAFLEFQSLLQELFALQGKSERIKNFPYPRQYATLSFFFVRMFMVFVPFASIPEFAKVAASLESSWPTVAPFFIWVSVPFSAIMSWMFHLVERIGRVGENPFEGTPNDVPISTISRGIEVDLREMLGQEPERMPPPLPLLNAVQM